MHLLHCNTGANRNTDLRTSWRYIEEYSKNISPQIRMQRSPQQLRSSVETILCRNSCCQTCWAALKIFTKDKKPLAEDAVYTPSSGKSILMSTGWQWRIFMQCAWKGYGKHVCWRTRSCLWLSLCSFAISWQLGMLSRCAFVRSRRLWRLFSFAPLPR